jgi:hypothetical protein
MNTNEKESIEQHAKGNTDNRQSDKSYFRGTRTMTILLLTVFGVGFTIAAGFAVNHLTNIGSYEHTRRAFYWMIPALVFFSLIVLLTTWEYLVKPAHDAQMQAERKAASKSPFEISVDIVMGDATRKTQQPVGWYEWIRPQMGQIISPIHRFLTIRITNRQKVISMVKTYRVEALTTDNEWVKLTRMSGTNGIIYWDGDIKEANRVDLIALDHVLESRKMAPDETLEGWAFFELPVDIPMRQPMRVYVQDFGGAEFSQVVEAPTGGGDFAQGMGFTGAGHKDLSKMTLKFYSEVEQP